MRLEITDSVKTLDIRYAICYKGTAEYKRLRRATSRKLDGTDTLMFAGGSWSGEGLRLNHIEDDLTQLADSDLSSLEEVLVPTVLSMVGTGSGTKYFGSKTDQGKCVTTMLLDPEVSSVKLYSDFGTTQIGTILFGVPDTPGKILEGPEKIQVESEVQSKKLVTVTLSDSGVYGINLSLAGWEQEIDPLPRMKDYYIRKSDVHDDIPGFGVHGKSLTDLTSGTFLGSLAEELPIYLMDRLKHARTGLYSEYVSYKSGDTIEHHGRRFRSLISENRGNTPGLSQEWEFLGDTDYGSKFTVISDPARLTSLPGIISGFNGDFLIRVRPEHDLTSLKLYRGVNEVSSNELSVIKTEISKKTGEYRISGLPGDLQYLGIRISEKPKKDITFTISVLSEQLIPRPIHHVAYANRDLIKGAWTEFSTLDPTGKEYIGVLTFAGSESGYSATPPNDPTLYRWAYVSGERDYNGNYCHIRYRNSSSDTNLKTEVATEKGIYYGPSKDAPSDPTQYNWISLETNYSGSGEATYPGRFLVDGTERGPINSGNINIKEGSKIKIIPGTTNPGMLGSITVGSGDIVKLDEPLELIASEPTRITLKDVFKPVSVRVTGYPWFIESGTFNISQYRYNPMNEDIVFSAFDGKQAEAIRIKHGPWSATIGLTTGFILSPDGSYKKTFNLGYPGNLEIVGSRISYTIDEASGIRDYKLRLGILKDDIEITIY